MPEQIARPSFFSQFKRSQVSSFAATILDYGTLFSLTELLHVYYVISVACGALIGATVNFFLNRHWSFESADGNVHHQALRYCLVSGGSLGLNTGGVYFVTEYFHIHYAISVVIVSLLVGFLFNFPLQRGFVFRYEEVNGKASPTQN
jgi:putative flippase GtrA